MVLIVATAPKVGIITYKGSVIISDGKTNQDMVIKKIQWDIVVQRLLVVFLLGLIVFISAGRNVVSSAGDSLGVNVGKDKYCYPKASSKLIRIGKRVLVVVIDLAIIIPLVFGFGLFIVLLGIFSKEFLSIFQDVLVLAIVVVYFIIVPRVFGYTIGGRILKVEKNNYVQKKEERKRDKLKKEQVTKVVIDGNFWVCPTCNGNNPASYDICRDCGQVVEKNK